MKCSKCNQEINEGSLFCRYCGAKVDTSEQNGQPQQNEQPQQNGQPQQYGQPPYMAYQQQPKKPLNKKVLGIIIGASVLLLAILIGVLVLVFTHKNTLDLADYVSVEFSGYDSVGSADLSFDENKFIEDMKDKGKNFSDSLFQGDEGGTDLLKICFGIQMKMDKDSKLSNEDKVVVVFEVPEEIQEIASDHGLKINEEGTTVEVKGLTEIREVDPFEGVNVKFSGTAPDGYAELEVESNEDFLSYYNYSLSQSYGIDVGDTVTVTWDMDEESLLSSHGVKLTSTSKDFVCEELDQYLRDGSMVSEETLTIMKSSAEQVINENFSYCTDYVTLDKLKYEGYYFLTKNNDDYGEMNMAYIVYSGVVSHVEEFSDYDKEQGRKHFKKTRVYFAIKNENIIHYVDGREEIGYQHTYLDGQTGLEYGWGSYVPGYESTDAIKQMISENYSNYQMTAFGELE